MQRNHFLWRKMYSQTCRLWVMRRWMCSPVSVGIEYRQLYTCHFIEKGMFLQYVFKQSALCLIACLISSQQRSANKAEQQVFLVQSTVVVAPKEKNQGALNEALRIATTEWGLTTQIIISSAYNNRWSVGSSACARTLIYAHNSGTTCLRVYCMSLHKNDPLHGLLSLSFCRWGPVTPCIYIFFTFSFHLYLFTMLTCGPDDADRQSLVSAALSPFHIYLFVTWVSHIRIRLAFLSGFKLQLQFAT